MMRTINIILPVILFFSYVDSQPTGKIITFNENGGWCWYQDERVIVHDGKLIIGSVANASGTDGASRSGDIDVVTYDIAEGGPPQLFTLHKGLDADDHAVPAFLVLADSSILTFYCRHSDNYKRYRINRDPADPLVWESEQLVARKGSQIVTYSNLHQLSDEDNRIYNFFRHDNFYGNGLNPNYMYSDDNGVTWTEGQLLRFDGQRPYPKYISNGVDKIHFIVTEGHPNEYSVNNIYHGYLKGGAIYKSDGIFLGNIADGPVSVVDLTEVFDGDVNNNPWTIDIHLNAIGHPYIVYSVWKNRNENDHRYRYARWDGAQWHDYELAYAGTRLYANERQYTGLAALDPQDLNRVYISTNADPRTGLPLISNADGKRHWELFVGTTNDAGATWHWQPITQNSVVDNLRPIVPIWESDQTVLLWLRGTYTTYTNYNLEVVGIFDPQPIHPDAPIVTDCPENVSPDLGDTVEFTAAFSSPLPMTYTWYHRNLRDSTFIVGGNSTTLTIENVRLVDQGYYYCVAANTAGTTVTTEASLLINNLIAHWTFDNTYNDSTENGHDAIPNGKPVFVDGYKGKAISLDGYSYLHIQNSGDFNFPTGYTIAVWIKTEGVDNPWATVLSKGFNCWSLMRNNDSRTMAFHINTGSGAVTVSGQAEIIDDKWHFVVGTFDGSNVTLYIDGLLDATIAHAGQTNKTSEPVWIGGRSDDFPDHCWNGLIDDVRIFNYVLTEKQVFELSGLPIPDFPKLNIDFGQPSSPVQTGYVGYLAEHEIASTFTSQTFQAFGAEIMITPTWTEGVTPQAMQMIDRAGNDGSDTPDLLRDWIGTDARQPGNPMTLTLAGLPAGSYQWRSYHHDTEDQTGLFDVTVNDATGSVTTTGIDITSGTHGIYAFENITTYSTDIVSDGISDITFVWDKWDQFTGSNYSVGWFVMNGFSLIRNDQISVETTMSNVPNKTIQLSQNYPNPFNPSTRITYYLPASNVVSLTIYNIAGQVIETLFSGYQSSGFHHITWHPKGLPSGIYFCRLQTEESFERSGNNYSVTKKLLFCK
jgi:hypothetical protein